VGGFRLGGTPAGKLRHPEVRNKSAAIQRKDSGIDSDDSITKFFSTISF
jgi:hypothetical protein